MSFATSSSLIISFVVHFFAQYPAHYGACNSSIDRWICVQNQVLSTQFIQNVHTHMRDEAVCGSAAMVAQPHPDSDRLGDRTHITLQPRLPPLRAKESMSHASQYCVSLQFQRISQNARFCLGHDCRHSTFTPPPLSRSPPSMHHRSTTTLDETTVPAPAPPASTQH